jgi:hypothetical protein
LVKAGPPPGTILDHTSCQMLPLNSGLPEGEIFWVNYLIHGLPTKYSACSENPIIFHKHNFFSFRYHSHNLSWSSAVLKLIWHLLFHLPHVSVFSSPFSPYQNATLFLQLKPKTLSHHPCITNMCLETW